jgi:ferrous iron transport protein B
MTETVIALAGNPNAGKTTLFNAFTGSRQHVGNYPGVTVEKKEGHYSHNGRQYKIVDLPGTYSLTAYSMEELVARDYLVNEKPALVINIVDAANLERNLYLSVQFMEMGIPIVLALNMIDVAKNRGIHIDSHALSDAMGVPVVPTIARRGEGREALALAAAQMADEQSMAFPLNISYGPDVDTALNEIEARIIDAQFLTDIYPARWTALKYLESDEQIITIGRRTNFDLSRILEETRRRLTNHLENTMDLHPEEVIADQRYGFIRSILLNNVVTIEKNQDRLFLSDRIDNVLTNRFAGPLIMAAVLFGLYHFTFTYSEYPVLWLESLFGWLGSVVDGLIPDGLVKSMIVSGVIDGVGGVLGFVPLIMFMFFGIAFLEDSGYMARVAYMLDRVFRIFGLHGASVMAFIISGGIAGGCAVPGVMATRTLRSPKERLATLLTVPFMNCGAKLPVFALLTAAFFSANQALVMFIITLGAWAGALLVAKLLRSTVVRGAPTPFVMELPPYRLPTFKGLCIHTWERTWQYVKKAGTVILGISIILWAMMTFPQIPASRTEQFDDQRNELIAAASNAERAAGHAESTDAGDTGPAGLNDQLSKIDAAEAESALRYSIAGRIGTVLETVSRWAGFDWRTNIALVGGFAAKEVVVSTLGTAYSLGAVDPEASGSLADQLAGAPGWRPLTAIALIIFTMFYAPCSVSVVCIAREAGSWKWGAFSIIFNTSLAFFLSVLVYQAGMMMGY